MNPCAARALVGLDKNQRQIKGKTAFNLPSLLPTPTPAPQMEASNPLEALLNQGSTSFAPWFEAWSNQWTQYQLLQLQDAYLGKRLFHSSTLTGFCTQELRNPSPKPFLAIGYLNTAHAHALNLTPVEAVPDVGLPQKLPEGASALWQHRVQIGRAHV